MNKPIIYTVGHSTHEIDYFVSLLKEYNVDYLIDVRSLAASSYNPQYNQEPLKNYLKKQGITYLHFPEEFGARFDDPDLLDGGKVDFEKVRKTFAFKNGMERLWQSIDKGHVIALMCSESDPLDCHRFSMVSVGLVKDGFEVKHIMKDKTVKDQKELEDRLLKKYDNYLPKPDMFNPNITIEDQLKEAYRLKNKEIGFSPYSKKPQTEDYD
jgi:uncharacterized protein (DUF488 family)